MNPITISGPYWPEAIRVLSVAISSYGLVTVEARGTETDRHYTTTLPQEQWVALHPTSDCAPTFRADPGEFALALEAQRLKLAYSCDPLLATNSANIHLLPHQVEAVYGVMLPQPRIRHLLAHDAGAGKTVMAGLLYKELHVRRSGLRTLIVAPAALTVQWQRELEDKLLAHFDIVDREELRADPGVWAHKAQAITSLPFARQTDVQASLANVSWDLVIVDEAHHLAAYEKSFTQAYRLGEILARQTHHLVLATATPHKGDAHNFLRLLQLLDPGIHDPAIVQRGKGQRGGPLMSRRLKEEMVDFDGHPLFKPRTVQTRWHRIGDNPPELELYSALTEYVHKTYRAAERLGGRERMNVQFAMIILQRRMGSSFAALERSLQRRRDHLLRPGGSGAGAPTPAPDLDELPEGERWQQEDLAMLASPARNRRERQKEAAEIERLLAQLDAVRRTGHETKVDRLQQVIAEAGVAPGNGEKLLVFTEFKDTLDFLLELFHGWGYTLTHLDGSMPHDLRRRAEREFRDRAQVMVATEAAGEGINLQFCARMVNYDLPWVPTRLEQRMGRIHRYGQQREALIYNMAAADTREGTVLVGLMARLDVMRHHLGDQVFDVISALISDVDLAQVMLGVALAPPTEAAQQDALNAVIAATQAGEDRYRQWEEHPFAIEPAIFRQMQLASREFRLTPEYAQHFFVSTLEQFKESPVAAGQAGVPAGDAAVIELEVTRRAVARALDVQLGRVLHVSFQQDAGERPSGVHFAALGTDLMDGMIRLAEEAWRAALPDGAVFLDPDLPPGGSYLLWFITAHALDGNGDVVARRLFAARQVPTALAPAPASALIDLMPAAGALPVPPALQALADDPAVPLNWSAAHQQLPFLAEASAARARITGMRREALLADAEAAHKQAEEAYGQAVFGDGKDTEEAERRVQVARHRLEELRAGLAREAACSLSAAQIVGVAAVVSAVPGPEEEMPDTRPDITAAAMRVVCAYEGAHGRTVKDVSGEHEEYPYDLHSTGPGGVRCIEVKGTTKGRVILSENERRAAHRLGKSYYLYVVRDPLTAAAVPEIIQDPLSIMTHDATLFGSVRYVYEAKTWQAAVTKETEP